MQEEKLILRAFLTEQFKPRCLEANEAILNAITSVVQIEEGEPDESKETRSIKITEDTDGKLAAASFKFFNLMKISFHDLYGFLLKESGIYFMEDDKVKIIFSLLFLFHDFSPKLTYTFNETDAKILLAIYEHTDGIKNKQLDIPGIQQAYYQHFKEPLLEAQATRSFNYFKELGVLKYLGEGQYVLREKITSQRN
jgi:hypothetical protein